MENEVEEGDLAREAEALLMCRRSDKSNFDINDEKSEVLGTSSKRLEPVTSRGC
jgi:hypothetical protein